MEWSELGLPLFQCHSTDQIQVMHQRCEGGTFLTIPDVVRHGGQWWQRRWAALVAMPLAPVALVRVVEAVEADTPRCCMQAQSAEVRIVEPEESEEPIRRWGS